MRCWWASSTTRATRIDSPLAFQTAHHCLLDTLGCGLEALSFPACSKLLGPLVPGISVVNGARVPGTHYVLDPVQAAFNIGAMVRWLDFNDTWLAAEWGTLRQPGWHPCRLRLAGAQRAGSATPTADRARRAAGDDQGARDQGVLALENSFNRVGLDHVLLVKVATTAVVAQLLGLDRERMLNALSLAWVDGQSRAPTGTHPTPARARAGPPATRPAVACAWR